jgi:hypothetical protein
MTELEVCIQENPGVSQALSASCSARQRRRCKSAPPSRGTIVVVNVAMLVSPDAIKTLNVPRLTTSGAELWLGQEMDCARGAEIRTRAEETRSTSSICPGCG